jgi:arylsulfatase A
MTLARRFGLFASLVLSSLLSEGTPPPAPTGIVIIVADDLGIGDVGAYGARHVRTPHLDQLAREGVRLTDFHVPAAQCTPARAALLTGRYPERIGMERVLFPDSPHGLPAEITTLPELLRERGFTTHAVGKWHLGDRPAALPTRHGFDTYWGIPYSHDMEPIVILDDTTEVRRNPPVPDFTRLWTDRAKHVLDQVAADEKFFLYLAHTAPHVPLGASPEFAGQSAFGPYGDTVEEMDAAIGELLDHLDQLGRTESTLVIFVSDNGPFQPWGVPDPHVGGFALPFRGAKASAREGGLRVPFIARWPAALPADEIRDGLAMAMDVWPTIERWTRPIGGSAPAETTDGQDMARLLETDTPDGARGAVAFYHYGRLESVREGPWLLTFARKRAWDLPFAFHKFEIEAEAKFGPGEEWLPPLLSNLDRDPATVIDYSAEYPAIRQRLEQIGEQFREDLGDRGRE